MRKCVNCSEGDYLKEEDILNIFRDLSRSQGFYGRLLRDLEDCDPDVYEDFMSNLEAQHFTDPVDLILYIEG